MKQQCVDAAAEEDRFFDSREEISSVSDSSSDVAAGESVDPNSRSFKWISTNSHYELWTTAPASVRERRDKFFRWMDSVSDLSRRRSADLARLSTEISAIDLDRAASSSDAVLRTSDFEEEFSSSRSSISSWAINAADDDNSRCRIRNLDDGTEFVVHGLGQDGLPYTLRQLGSNQLFTIDEFQRTLGLSSAVQHIPPPRDVVQARVLAETIGRTRKKGWLRRLGTAMCVVDRQREGRPELGDSGCAAGGSTDRIRVRMHKKRCKELSALYLGQEIQAHEGSILTIKFSPCGKYLASAGEDGVVRIWEVIECARSDDCEISKLDPSCVYFQVNDSSELSPLVVDKEKLSKFTSMRKTMDSSCIIFPPRVFRISEKPLHEFHGHTANVLDLSWSKNKYLLSSSEDKTVRLWQVGCHRCIKVFSHSNYVTCVQFNPVNDEYFISGSIDGKVRIWAIPACHVVDWVDIREIVTAVCYRPNGQGVMVGSMTGDCRFYDTSGNHLQLEADVCLQARKKSPLKRIVRFQFSPNDHRKVMVVSADSHIRIIDGNDIICKYRGMRNSGNQLSASFTSDGKHIISVGEDSNVCIWNHNSPDGPLPIQAKSIHSCESFFSSNALVAIPWFGMKSETIASNEQVSSRKFGSTTSSYRDTSDSSLISLSYQDSFLLSHDLFLEALPKGSATWPEEKLPASSSHSPASAIFKSHYKFLKTSYQNTATSHAWGLVIVTAGRDGRIRLYHNYGLPVRL